MHCQSIQMKKLKMMRDDLNSVRVILTGNKFFIKNFKAKVKQGPFCVCVICNRCLYYTNVLLFDIAKYNNEFISKLNIKLSRFDSKSYICWTSYSYAKKLKVPFQAIANDVFLENIPEELGFLNDLLVVLIAKRLLFKKSFIMPKRQTPKNSWINSKCTTQY